MTDEIRVIDEFPFTFYGDTFTVALGSDRRLYVPLPLVCSPLGVDASAQIKRIQRDEAISDSLITLTVQAYPYGEGRSRQREVSCLRLDRLPYWLGTIDIARVTDKARKKDIVRFKREFAEVAWAAFRTEILPSDVLAEFDAYLPADEQAYHAAMDEAADLRRGLVDHEGRLDSIEERVTGLEARFEGTDFINPAQAKQYQQMVYFLAEILKKKGKPGYAAVHGEVKKAFKVPSYMLIPEARFPDVIKFLSSWYQRITPPGTPLPDAFTRPDQKRLL